MKDREKPLSVRIDRATRSWLEDEAARRSAAAGTRSGPSSVARAILEAAARGARPSFDLLAFRKKWNVDRDGFEDAGAYFAALRDSSAGRAVEL